MCGSWARLPGDLLEAALGHLDVDDITGARVTCQSWHARRARGPVLLHPLSVSFAPVQRTVHWSALQHVRLFLSGSLPAALDLRDLEQLRTLYLEEPWSLQSLLCSSRARVHVVALQRLRGDLAQQWLEVVHELDWKYQAGSTLLSRVLRLPRLEKLTLRQAGSAIPTAGAGCPLQQLVFVDCWNLDLEFMDTLSCLKSVGIWRQNLGIGVLPWNIPLLSRSRIEQLDLRLDNLCPRPAYGDIPQGLSIQGFESLRWLLLQATTRSQYYFPLTHDVQQLAALETLKLRLNAPNICYPGPLTSLEIDHEHWASSFHNARALRELVLHNYVGQGLPMDLTRCSALQKLRVVAGPRCISPFRAVLPTALRCLELVGLAPVDHLTVPTLYLELWCFLLMTPPQQERLKANVANLYTVERLRGNDRPFASSFFSREK